MFRVGATGWAGGMSSVRAWPANGAGQETIRIYPSAAARRVRSGAMASSSSPRPSSGSRQAEAGEVADGRKARVWLVSGGQPMRVAAAGFAASAPVGGGRGRAKMAFNLCAREGLTARRGPVRWSSAGMVRQGGQPSPLARWSGAHGFRAGCQWPAGHCGQWRRQRPFPPVPEMTERLDIAASVPSISTPRFIGRGVHDDGIGFSQWASFFASSPEAVGNTPALRI